MKSYKDLSLEKFIAECNKITERITQIGTTKQKPVVYDGVIDPRTYYEVPLKIMWILKEAYTYSNESWSYCCKFKDKEWLDDDNMTIRRVMYASYGILHGKNRTWENYQDECLRHALCEIAFVNIKKIPNCKSSLSERQELKQAYAENRELLREQTSLYDPNVIIFGGTEEYVDFGEFSGLNPAPIQRTDFGNAYYDARECGKLYISTYHPGAWIKNEEKYVMDLVAIVQKWQKI